MKEKGKFFLIYSIILFSVAFILILFSSFTGIRYKDEQNRLFMGAQESVVTLTEKNESLEKENNEKTQQIIKLTSEKEKAENDLKTITEEKEKIILNMDLLSSVQTLYSKKNYSEAARVLETIDSEALSENGKTLYNSLKNRLY